MIASRLLVLVPLAALGCGSHWIDYAPTGPRRPTEPHPANQIQVFISTRPACAYNEVGLVESNQTGFSWWRSVPDIIEAMKQTAAREGGDAIILMDHSDSHQGGHGYTGVVVQYDGSCMTVGAR